MSNPLEFSWRMASQFGADCYLIVAPAIVEFADHQAPPDRQMRPRHACSRWPKTLDLAVVIVGDINPQSTSLAAGMIEASELRELLALGAVADVLCNFLDDDGQSVPHALNRRVMSVDLEAIRNAGHVAHRHRRRAPRRRHPRRDQAHRLQHADHRRGRGAGAAGVNDWLG